MTKKLFTINFYLFVEHWIRYLTQQVAFIFWCSKQIRKNIDIVFPFKINALFLSISNMMPIVYRDTLSFA